MSTLVTDSVYSNIDEEYHEVCEFLNRLAEPALSDFLYDSLFPHTKRKVHKYGKRTS